ncbi:hypothetical protein [Neptuniibacter sp. QD37_11]|uniref:hypothetical protein n=1 Tax=Neptuniibacter sp. QD37_11 TaxID=3398209 RepID=UPI0039F588C3
MGNFVAHEDPQPMLLVTKKKGHDYHGCGFLSRHTRRDKRGKRKAQCVVSLAQQENQAQKVS